MDRSTVPAMSDGTPGLIPGSWWDRRRALTAFLVLWAATLVALSCAHAPRVPFAPGGGFQLGSLRKGTARFEFNRPAGVSFSRLIVVCPRPDGERLRASLKGKLSVKGSDGPGLEVSLSPGAVTECTWFKESEKFTGYFLHWPNTLEQQVGRGRKILLELELAEDPPASARLWVFYLPWWYGF